MNLDTTDLLLATNIAEVNQASWQVKLARMMQIASNDSSNEIKLVDLSVFVQKSIDILFDEGSIVVSLLENWVIEDSFEEAKVVAESYDFIVAKGLLHEFDGLLPVFTISDELGNHRIVES